MQGKNKKRTGAARGVLRRDPAKEARVAELVAELVARGFVVRREELKRGLGWRALSGVCRVFEQDTVFVDRRLGVDDQIAFLEARLALAKESSKQSDNTNGSPPVSEDTTSKATASESAVSNS